MAFDLSDIPGMKLWGDINPSVGAVLDKLGNSEEDKLKAENERLRSQIPKVPGTSMKKGGTVKAKSKPKSSASKRGDGIASRGKTKGRFV